MLGFIAGVGVTLVVGIGVACYILVQISKEFWH